MTLRLEDIRIGGENFYSVIDNEGGVDRLVLQTTNRSLAQTTVNNGWTDGTKIPKEVMERAGQKDFGQPKQKP